MEAVVLGVLFIVFIIVGAICGILANNKVNALEREVAFLKEDFSRMNASARDVVLSQHKDKRTSQAVQNTKRKAPPADDHETKDIPMTVTPVPASSLAKPAAPNKPAPLHTTRMQTPKPKAKLGRSFEEELGARWAVWVGGIALLFGTVFLLRYTIEAGFFTPIMRISLAALLGVCALIVGEFFRRQEHDKTLPLAVQNIKHSAYIPGVLTAVGIFALYGSIYAAYAIFGFVSALPALTLLGLVSFGALGLSLLHGPKMAGLGLVASMVTPLLVSTTTPNVYTLYLYLGFISCAAIALAMRKAWDWLIPLTLVGCIGWLLISLDATQTSPTLWAWYAFLAFVYSAYLYATNHKDSLSNLWQGIPLLCAMTLLASAMNTNFAITNNYVGIGGAFVLMICGWVLKQHKYHIIFGGVLAALLTASFSIWHGTQDISEYHVVINSLIFGGLILSMGFMKASHEQTTQTPPFSLLMWVAFSIVFPLGMSMFASEATGILKALKIANQAALIFAYAWCVEMVWRKSNHKLLTLCYGVGAALAYILCAFTTFDGHALVLALFVPILVCALLYTKRPLVILRQLSVGFALLGAAYILFIRIPMHESIGSRMLWNALWLYFAFPCALCFGAWKVLLGKADDIWFEGLKALTLVFGTLFVVFQIRHMMNEGQVLNGHFSFEEIALHVLTGFSFSLGASIISPSQNTKTYPLVNYIALYASFFSIAIFAFVTCGFQNPLFNDSIDIHGNFAFNSLLLGYLAPSLILGLISWFSYKKRPEAYVKIAAALALLSLVFYLTAMVRFAFSGASINIFNIPFSNAELYLISVTWLALGICMLVLGIKFQQQKLRFASAAVITITVLKAFFIDMASLEGILRALSFVVLGVVLILIGRVYQKLLFTAQDTKKHSAQSVQD